MCVGKLLPRRNFLNNIHVNFWINYCKNFYTLSEQTPIIAIINDKKKKNEGKNEKSVING